MTQPQEALRAQYYPESSATDLPPVRRFITGHGADGAATVQRADGGQWTRYDTGSMAFNVLYTTSKFPVEMNKDEDVHAHDSLIDGGMLGLVNPKGSVLRIVDFGPGLKGRMHRTQSLDYGIVLDGEVDMVLDNDETHRLRRGDVAVQRATIHQWCNPTDKWARVAFVLLDSAPLSVKGERLHEDLGGPARYPASGNDQ
ncbi:uncharacterized protein A1O9_03957 [Exophiala aquamarina CBS 119918]|uniref:Cupin type-2 domain-containing protein n=1 Tax=Exophiala aquamarina CBS 119918 TaxID=1182545 RepID=A0A072PIF9_9EURO|nr:uncharacterized protein A1O9_03957 [Exophiala aquamarina CBS 119918]KEF59113.1 hypothetical protein A1O9_03957 [Exophiala aquamarina CBS 119918]